MANNRVVPLGFEHDALFQGELAERIPYHRMYGKQYCVPSLILYAPYEVEALQQASEQIDRIYEKTLRFAQRYLPDSFLKKQLGIHPALIAAARIEVPGRGVSRQDWILTGEGMKCIENNTDTPTGVPETAYLAPAVTAGTPYSATSSGMRTAIQHAFRRLIEHYRSSGLTGRIAFTSYGWHIEDKTNTLYLMEAVQELGYEEVVYIPLEELGIVPGEGLYGHGELISILYRLYPLEYLVHDTDEQSDKRIGVELLKLVAEGKLGLINPAQSVLTQSKGFMALIWSLYERRHEMAEYVGFELYDKEDLASIEAYLLPTYYDDRVFRAEGIAYAAKSYWGREGKGTALLDGEGRVEHAECGMGPDSDEAQGLLAYYDSQPKIYQQRIPMEEASIRTEDSPSPFVGCLLTGAFVIGGRFSGLLPRVGGRITGDMAYYCPAAVLHSSSSMTDSIYGVMEEDCRNE
jgi:glutathionylspermidine synthase